MRENTMSLYQFCKQNYLVEDESDDMLFYPVFKVKNEKEKELIISVHSRFNLFYRCYFEGDNKEFETDDQAIEFVKTCLE